MCDLIVSVPDHCLSFYFTQKPVPPGTVLLGWFAQNFELGCSLKITGTVHSKSNLLGQFVFFNA